MKPEDPQEYFVVSRYISSMGEAKEIEVFCTKVEQYLQDGWKIVGGHNVSASSNGRWFSQTLVRTAQDKMVNNLTS